MKVIKEWFIDVQWGRIALISWGTPQGEPVLLMHGRQDSAATFVPLLGLLPDVYHYVGFDLPGHGMSDGFPIGVTITRFMNVVALDAVIKHLEWRQFTFVGHSLGVELGLFYNAIYPNQIKKFIIFDPASSLQRIVIQDFPKFYYYYNNYYENYSKINNNDRVYSKQNALKAVMKARSMTESQAELILSRNLKKIGDDQYRMSWDLRTRLMPPTIFPPEYYFQLFSKNCPPTLCINATDTLDFYVDGKETVNRLLADLEKTLRNFTIIRVEGNHDFHFLHPERISKNVCSFLKKDFGDMKSKL
ncbi:serine hydrolase-like protein isoform X1 [Maniola hyperantus]|uniref:serine hydrolase-like protein isoform X1 n=2 Tax=Aphantopus hyperantus TaxID=2795564 RepID=UPI00156990DF|nr:serine hydrolase-like protein [Maniola hyperantus]XP_034838236.1 serine hydrolase-like protein [Maniola hyperantus]